MLHSENNPNSLIPTAKRLAKKHNQEYFVIYCPDYDGNYHVCTSFDLDSFYQGVSDQNILWSSWNVE